MTDDVEETLIGKPAWLREGPREDGKVKVEYQVEIRSYDDPLPVEVLMASLGRVQRELAEAQVRASDELDAILILQGWRQPTAEDREALKRQKEVRIQTRPLAIRRVSTWWQDYPSSPTAWWEVSRNGRTFRTPTDAECARWGLRDDGGMEPE